MACGVVDDFNDFGFGRATLAGNVGHRHDRTIGRSCAGGGGRGRCEVGYDGGGGGGIAVTVRVHHSCFGRFLFLVRTAASVFVVLIHWFGTNGTAGGTAGGRLHVVL